MCIFLATSFCILKVSVCFMPCICNAFAYKHTLLEEKNGNNYPERDDFPVKAQPAKVHSYREVISCYHFYCKRDIQDISCFYINMTSRTNCD